MACISGGCLGASKPLRRAGAWRKRGPGFGANGSLLNNGDKKSDNIGMLGSYRPRQEVIEIKLAIKSRLVGQHDGDNIRVSMLRGKQEWAAICEQGNRGWEKKSGAARMAVGGGELQGLRV